MINMVKLPTKKSDLFLRVAKGHFATSHSHINYYKIGRASCRERVCVPV